MSTSNGRVARFDAPQGPVTRTNANPVRPNNDALAREAQQRIAAARVKLDADKAAVDREVQRAIAEARVKLESSASTTAHHDEADNLSPSAALAARSHGAFEARHQGSARTDGSEDLSPAEALNARTAGAFERNGAGR